MSRLLKWYSWRHIKCAVWLFKVTRHECNHCCLWCEYFDQCYEDVVCDLLKEEEQ